MLTAKSKYTPLWEHLQKIGAPQIKLTFEDVHDILGFEIDHSFLNFKKEITAYGYHVGKISLKEKIVIFTKKA